MASAHQVRMAALAMAEVYAKPDVIGTMAKAMGEPAPSLDGFYPYAMAAIDALHVATKGHGKWMPIQTSAKFARRRQKDSRLVVVDRVPFLLLSGEMAERQAAQSYGRSLQELADRGGITACEAVCLISGVPWSDLTSLDEEQAHRILDAFKTVFTRGKLFAEGALA